MEKATATKTEKYLTESIFEKHMGSIAESFSVVEERFEKMENRLDKHEQVLSGILTTLEVVREDSSEIRRSVKDISAFIGTHENKIDNNLTLRVEKLERKAA